MKQVSVKGIRKLREWKPTGIYPPLAKPMVLSDDHWDEVQTTVKARLGLDAPANLRQALNDSLYIYLVADRGVENGTSNKGSRDGHTSAPALPSQIRRNLKHARTAALRLLDRVNDLDGNSRQLVNETSDFGLQSLFDAVGRAIELINAAETSARQLPKNRKGIKNYSSRNMGFMLARAVQHFFGKEALSTTRDGLYHQLFLIVCRALDAPDQDRGPAIRSAVLHYRNRAHENDIVPPLS